MKNQVMTPPDLILPEGMVIQPKQITKEDLKRKFEEFKADNTNLERVRRQGIQWIQPGFLIELFIADFSAISLLAATNEYYKRYTGVAKILSVSPENDRLTTFDGVSREAYKSIKEGDTVFLGDDLSYIQMNPKWQEWYDHQGRGAVKGVEPIKYIRKFHRWIEAGMLYLIDRSKEVIEKEGLEINLSTIGTLDVPMVFRLPPQDVLFKIENPFD